MALVPNKKRRQRSWRAATNTGCSSIMTKIQRKVRALRFLSIVSLLLLSCGATALSNTTSWTPCPPPLQSLDNATKRVYTVGVLAIRGANASFQEFNDTFATYLTETVGRRYTPPLQFRMQPLTFRHVFEKAVARHQVDFVHVNPSLFSCLESEIQAQSLVSQISRRTVGGTHYDFTQFGGVIVTLANHSGIYSIRDLKDKIIAAASISGLGSGQMQFREMQLTGLSYINDPKQLVFTSNQEHVVQGLLKGDFDVGFIRTDQLERSAPPGTNLTLWLQQFRIINPQRPRPLLENGQPFPFETSTPLYPEWNLAALPHVPQQISLQVLQAMTALQDHAKLGKSMMEICPAYYGDGDDQDPKIIIDPADLEECLSNMQFPLEFSTDDNPPRCDVTPTIAKTAWKAMVNGKYAGWRTTLSYLQLRSMQETTGFIKYEPQANNQWRCVRSEELYDGISCPSGYFRKTRQEVAEGCAELGLSCHDNYQCVCQPCHKGYDVDVYPLSTASNHHDFTPLDRQLGCVKMSLCGTTQQGRSLAFQARDNLERPNGTMTVILHENEGSRQVEVDHTRASSHFIYEFTIEYDSILGMVTIEIFLNDEQIPESPLRVSFTKRDCSSDYGSKYEANDAGECVCRAGYVTMGTSCVGLGIFVMCVVAPLIVFVAIVSFVYVQHKRREADSLWTISPWDLKFPEPVVLGQGYFGVVVLGDLRGTRVACKQVLPTLHTAEIDTNRSPEKDMQQVQQEEQAPRSLLQSATRDVDIQGETTVGSVEAPGQPTTLESAVREAAEDPVLYGSQFHSGLRPDSQASHQTSPREFWKKVSTALLCHGAEADRYERQRTNFIREMRLLSKLRHPCITTVMGAVVHRGYEPLLVLEWMMFGSLHDLLHNDTLVLDGELILPIMRDIAQGVRFLHSGSPQIIHCDLKSNNVLLTQGFRAKLSDFGLSSLQPKNNHQVHQQRHSHYHRTGNQSHNSEISAKSHRSQSRAIGTPYFMAPELLRGESSNTPESDMYSVGMVLYELYSRRDPYEGLHTESLLYLICDPMINKRPMIPESCPPEISKLIRACWKASPWDRPTAEDMDEHLKHLTVENAEPTISNNRIRRRLPQLLDKSEDLLRNQRQDSLYGGLPPRIANALSRGEKVDPELYPNVSIVMVGLTEEQKNIGMYQALTNRLAAKPAAIDPLLPTLKKLCQQHGLFALVETIGPTFMAAANLADNQEHDHAKRAASFAQDIFKEAQQNGKKGQKIQILIHSGPVVGSVVGSMHWCPRYCLLGNTVSMTCRLFSFLLGAQSAASNRILCSPNFASLLRQQSPKSMLHLVDDDGTDYHGSWNHFNINSLHYLQVSTDAGLSGWDPQKDPQKDPQDEAALSS